MAYKVLVNCENDETEKRFKPGDVVTEKDLPKGVIEHWLKKGVLKKTTSAPKRKPSLPKAKKSEED